MSLYATYRQAFQDRSLPLAYVDLDLLDRNIQTILQRRSKGTIRLATKSIRCRSIIRSLLDSQPSFQGLMTYSPWEAAWLASEGFDDLLMGYPSMDREALSAIVTHTKAGKQITLMVDRVEHLALLQQIAEEQNCQLTICLDLDLSFDLPGLHFGVWRSALRSVEDVAVFLDHLAQHPNLTLVGLMGYEAQIAGLGTAVPKQWLKNQAIRFLQKLSLPRLQERRRAACALLRERGYSLQLVNGGGTGSMETTLAEADVTEVTVGSGFFHSHLFDYYSHFNGQAAAGFALPIVRQPKQGLYTCHGGGYIASGAIDHTKAPIPYLPQGSRLDPQEGVGEVQTPVYYGGPEALGLGDPIFFRHAKAGELCERFNTLHLIRNGAVAEEVPTFRGEGRCFL